MHLRTKMAVALVVGLSTWVGRASAQLTGGEPSSLGVVGTGSATIQRQANLLRLQILVSASGKDVKDALEKLKAKQTSAKEKLQKLGAADASVSFSDPVPQDETQQQQMQRMIQMRTNRAAKSKGPEVVTLSTTLKAEWPLSKSGDDAVVEALELQQKIKSADLGGEKEKPADAESQEAAEEAQGMSNDGQPNPHDPTFLFVATITDAERDKAEADAFKKASRQAERLAKAGGGELGAVRLLASHAVSTDIVEPPYFYGGYRQSSYSGMINGTDDDSPLEAVGAQPGKVSYKVAVYVSYDLKK